MEQRKTMARLLGGWRMYRSLRLLLKIMIVQISTVTAGHLLPGQGSSNTGLPKTQFWIP